MPTLRSPCFLLIVPLLAGCSGQSEGRVAEGVERAAVFDGDPSPQSDDAVVQVRMSFGSPCTGTLVAPNVVVTALSCVSVYRDSISVACNQDGSHPENDPRGSIGVPFEADDVEVYFGADSGFNSGAEPAAFGVALYGTGSNTICSDNIVAIVLDRKLPEPGIAVRVDRPVVAGEEVSVVGYNVLEPSRRRRSHLPVLAVGPDDLSQGAGDLVPRAFLLGEGPCQGDTGGPAISEDTGALVGLLSFTTNGRDWDCAGDRHLYTKIAPFVALLEQALGAAGEGLRIEGEPVDETATPDAGGCSFAARRLRAPYPLVLMGMILVLAGLRRLRSGHRVSE
jgi:hypothetical protein